MSQSPPTPLGDVSSLTGRVFGSRYRLEEPIGRGGMSIVYRAVCLRTKATVALKIMTGSYGQDDKKTQRFEQEAQASARLNHPGIIEVSDYGRSGDGLLFIAMELLRGETLGRKLRKGGPQAVGDACRLMQKTCEALSVAHEQGVIHRDLKPDNIYLLDTASGEPFEHIKLLDFGIAKVAGSGDVETLTETGFICGTPLYISPEQALGMTLDGRSDLYAVGVLLFELLTGKPPFHAETPIALVMKHIHNEPPAIEQVNPSARVPPALDALIRSLLSKDREERPASALVVSQQLAEMAYEYRAIPAAFPVDAPHRREVSLPAMTPSGLELLPIQLGAGAFDTTRDDLPEFELAPSEALITAELEAPMRERMRVFPSAQHSSEIQVDQGATQSLAIASIEQMREITARSSKTYPQKGRLTSVANRERTNWTVGAGLLAVCALSALVFGYTGTAETSQVPTSTSTVDTARASAVAHSQSPAITPIAAKLPLIVARGHDDRTQARQRQGVVLEWQPAAPLSPAVPRDRAIRIVSQPSGASIVMRGEVVGQTPYEFTVNDTTSATTLIVQRYGFLPQSWHYSPQNGLPTSQTQVTLVLEKDTRRQKRRSNRRKKIRWEE